MLASRKVVWSEDVPPLSSCPGARGFKLARYRLSCGIRVYLPSSLSARLLPLVEQRIVMNHPRELQPRVLRRRDLHRRHLRPCRDPISNLSLKFLERFLPGGALCGPGDRLTTGRAKAIPGDLFDQHEYLHRRSPVRFYPGPRPSSNRDWQRVSIRRGRRTAGVRLSDDADCVGWSSDDP